MDTIWLVARGGIEPPTRGFSVRARRFQGLNNQPLAALASPDPRHTKAQSRHTQSEFGTFSAHGIFANLRGSSNSAEESFIVPGMTKEDLGVDNSLLESVAKCLDAESVRALGTVQLSGAAKSRLELLAQKANEGQLTADEAREYDRFIELGDIIATLRLKAERQMQVARG